MKLKFRVSPIYIKQLNKEITNQGVQRVKKISKQFLIKYIEEIDKIVKMLPKITGKKWPVENGNEIEVYFVDWKGPSFSHPVTLKIREDLLLMLAVLTHELGHHLVSLKTKEGQKRINDIVKKTFEKLKINAEKQIELIRKWSEK